MHMCVCVCVCVCVGQVFHVSLHVPALRVEEVVRVLRAVDSFNLSDIPDAVDTLSTHYGKTVPIKKLLLWLEMAKQVRGRFLSHTTQHSLRRTASTVVRLEGTGRFQVRHVPHYSGTCKMSMAPRRTL